MPRIEWLGAYFFLSVNLLVFLFVVNFNLHHNFWTIWDFILGMHAYSNNEILFNDNKVNDPVTLTDFYDRNSFFGLCCHKGGGIVFHKHITLILNILILNIVLSILNILLSSQYSIYPILIIAKWFLNLGHHMQR